MKYFITLFGIVLLAHCAFAQEYVNNEFHFSITLPADKGWSPPQITTSSNGALKKPMELVWLATQKSGNKISITIISVDSDLSMSSENFRKGFKEGVVEKCPPGFHVVHDKVSSVEGIASYQLSIFGAIRGTPVNMRMIALCANGYEYNLTAYSNDTTALIQPDLEEVLSTFRFTDPPTPPVVEDTSFEKGKLLGKITGYLLVIGLIGFFVIRHLRRPKSA